MTGDPIGNAFPREEAWCGMARKVEVLLGGRIPVSANPSVLCALAARRTLIGWILDAVADAVAASVETLGNWIQLIRVRAGN